jgi:hypothetical protein
LAFCWSGAESIADTVRPWLSWMQRITGGLDWERAAWIVVDGMVTAITLVGVSVLAVL